VVVLRAEAATANDHIPAADVAVAAADMHSATNPAMRLKRRNKVFVLLLNSCTSPK
jgi:hypothetical protein